ncbi:ExbD/TolR family protein [Marinagarivorans cellulosilyticus]|uniref:Biopolymer transport protein ExbD n=1 Tax=Marinagarivorans cellulosilyticus TaxID=2721545 RepID=A0AAN1WL23_9GAMM|nr:biopolymer transporter ExbD [Marinagarivorans cellulosilyticus]BCD99549.1 biopolymer transport protein ExbD [Marinagarivorans cellulosilyticus]
MQFRRQTNSQEDINLTPLIDVVFLLLIFFMVSTTFTKETHLKLDLPQAEGEPLPELVDKIEVLINADGGYAINGKPLVNTKLETLMTGLEVVGKGLEKDKIPFVITADANVSYQSVVMAMDVAGRLGFVNITMTTKRPDGT